MYFQKLEALSQLEEFTNLTTTIEALDYWLATLPKSYRDKIIPEHFSRDEKQDYRISYKLFDKLAEVKLFGEVYALKCSKCRSIIYYSNDLNEVFEYMIDFNSNQFTCDYCDCQHNVSTNDIYIFYKLVDKPIEKKAIKKKNSYGYNDDGLRQRNLSTRILENPQKYAKIINPKLINEISPTEVTKALKFILEQHIR